MQEEELKKRLNAIYEDFEQHQLKLMAELNKMLKEAL